jgi:hypothetical protein
LDADEGEPGYQIMTEEKSPKTFQLLPMKNKTVRKRRKRKQQTYITSLKSEMPWIRL